MNTDIKQAMHVEAAKSFGTSEANENERRWNEDKVDCKNQDPTNNYDKTRMRLNFEIGPDGKIHPLGYQEKSLELRLQERIINRQQLIRIHGSRMPIVTRIFDLHAMHPVRKSCERNRIPSLGVQRSARREGRQAARVRQIRGDGNLHTACRRAFARAYNPSADAGRHSVDVAASRRVFHRCGQLLLRPCRRRQQRD